MKRLKKDYYTLREAVKRSDRPIDDFLSLAEQRDIRLWVVAHRWPIVWGDESDSPSAPSIGIKKPIKQTLDYCYSGYLSLCRYDIRNLRTCKKCSLLEVHAEKDGQSFVGRIHLEEGEIYLRKHKFEFKIDKVFVSHEDLLRVEKEEVGEWEEPVTMFARNFHQSAWISRSSSIPMRNFLTEGNNGMYFPGKIISCGNKDQARSCRSGEKCGLAPTDTAVGDQAVRNEASLEYNTEFVNREAKTELKPTDTIGDARAARKPQTRAIHWKWQQEYLELKKKHPDKSGVWIANKIAKQPIAKGRKPSTIRRKMKSKKS